MKNTHDTLNGLPSINISNVSRISSGPRIVSDVGILCTDWSRKDFSVICRQAGFAGFLRSSQPKSVKTDNPFRFSGIGCYGNETGIELCKHSLHWSKTEWNAPICGQRISVTCTSMSCKNMHTKYVYTPVWIRTHTYVHFHTQCLEACMFSVYIRKYIHLDTLSTTFAYLL